MAIVVRIPIAEAGLEEQVCAVAADVQVFVGYAVGFAGLREAHGGNVVVASAFRPWRAGIL